MTFHQCSLTTAALLVALLLTACDAPPAALSPAKPTTPPVAAQPAPEGAGLPAGTVVITSKASEQATPQERQAVVDRILAPASAATASTGLSPEAACQAVKQAVRGRYPQADPKIIDILVDKQHKDVVVLSRRSNGTFDSEYYMKNVNERLDDIIARYPQMSGQK